MLRVVVFGSYKPPREMTWLSGLALLGLVLALCADRLPPAVGSARLLGDGRHDQHLAAGAGRRRRDGGSAPGRLDDRRADADALVLGARHLPAGAPRRAGRRALVLMRLQGSSGPVRPNGRAVSVLSLPGVPRHGCRVGRAARGRSRWRGAACRRSRARPIRPTPTTSRGPSGISSGLFQLLKYFPGKWEVVGAIVIPGRRGGVPRAPAWIDRGPERDPRRRPLVMALVAVGLAGRRRVDDARMARSADDRQRAISGRSARSAGARLPATAAARSATPTPGWPIRSSRWRCRAGAEWVSGHVIDPEMIAPGLREPPAARSEREVAAILAYVRRVSRQPYPGYPAERRSGRRGVGALLRRLPQDRRRRRQGRPRALARGRQGRQAAGRGDDPHVDRRSRSDRPAADMPSFGKRLSPEQLDAIAGYLASRK